MPPFPLVAFLASLPWTAAALVVLLALTYAVAVRQSRHSVVDTVWGLGFAVVAADGRALTWPGGPSPTTVSTASSSAPVWRCAGSSASAS
jgi:steroid 5-alpha reductase family enzyme